MNFKVIILDFDGTIVESVGIKDEAFRVLFQEYPMHMEKIIEYHLSHNATVRFEKFRHIVENILGQEYSKKTDEHLCTRFSDLVFQEIIKCPYVEGAEEFLNYYFVKAPLYLASASPASELDKILSARGLKKYFRCVYAIPWEKTDILGDIIKRENVAAADVTFIGDSYEDYKAAHAKGVHFVGRNSGKSFHGANIPVYDDMVEIKKYFQNLDG
jgi:phosphoglycolate phosphatase-like HAD superfamily hydrolase